MEAENTVKGRNRSWLMMAQFEGLLSIKSIYEMYLYYCTLMCTIHVTAPLCASLELFHLFNIRLLFSLV